MSCAIVILLGLWRAGSQRSGRGSMLSWSALPLAVVAFEVAMALNVLRAGSAFAVARGWADEGWCGRWSCHHLHELPYHGRFAACHPLPPRWDCGAWIFREQGQQHVICCRRIVTAAHGSLEGRAWQQQPVIRCLGISMRNGIAESCRSRAVCRITGGLWHVIRCCRIGTAAHGSSDPVGSCLLARRCARWAACRGRRGGSTARKT